MAIIRSPNFGEAPAEFATSMSSWRAVGSTALFFLALVQNLQGDDSKHWAFRPIQKPTPPSVTDRERVQTPTDRFILNALESKKLTLARS
jgi:hypothetical protein